jgi:hypothetical protein
LTCSGLSLSCSFRMKRGFKTYLAVCATLISTVLLTASCSSLLSNKQQENGAIFKFTVAGELAPSAEGKLLFAGKGPFAELESFLQSRDVVMADFAGAVCNSGDAYSWRMNWLDGMTNSGLRAFNLANDRSLSCGKDGLGRTMSGMSERGLYVIGAGLGPREASTPIYLTSNGITVGVASFLIDKPAQMEGCEDCPLPSVYERSNLLRAIADMRRQADHIIIFLHYSERDQPDLERTELRLARTALALGADMVIGYGANTGGGLRRYRGKWIISGMGKLTGKSADGFEAVDGLLLSMEFTKSDIMNPRLAPLSIKGGLPTVLRGEEAASKLQGLLNASTPEVRENATLHRDILYLRQIELGVDLLPDTPILIPLRP